jgi:hypothetical protein
VQFLRRFQKCAEGGVQGLRVRRAEAVDDYIWMPINSTKMVIMENEKSNSRRESNCKRSMAYYNSKKLDPVFMEKCNARSKLYFARKQKAKLENLVKLCKQCGNSFRPQNDRFDYCSQQCQRNRENSLDNLRNRTPEAKARRNAFLKRKLSSNPEFKLRCLVSKQVWRALKLTRSVKSDSVLKFLPYSIVQLKAHLESFFNNSNAFTWSNHGKVWHIDHIIPQSIFPYTDLDSKMFRDCWALSNLMPSKNEINQAKGNRFIGTETATGQLVFIAS